MSRQPQASLHHHHHHHQQLERVKINTIDSNPPRKQPVLEISNLLCESTLPPLGSPKNDAFFNESQASPRYHYLNTRGSSPTPDNSPQLSPYKRNSRPYHHERSSSDVSYLHRNKPLHNAGESIFRDMKSPQMCCHDPFAQRSTPLIKNSTSLPDLRSENTDQKDRSRLLLPLPSISFPSDPSKPWIQTQRLEQFISNQPESWRSPNHSMAKSSGPPFHPTNNTPSTLLLSNLASFKDEQYSPDPLAPCPIRNSKQDSKEVVKLESSHLCSTKSCTIPLEETLHAQIQRHRQLCSPYSNTNRLEIVKPKRKRANADQLKVLNQVFQQTFFPPTELRIQLGRQLGMSPRTVQIWFQNKRQSLRSRSQGVGEYIRTSTSVSNQNEQRISNNYVVEGNDGGDNRVMSRRSSCS